MNYFIAFVVGTFVGWCALRLWAIRRMKKMLGSIADTPLPKDQIDNKVEIDLVRIKTHVYAYDRKDQAFLASGSTKQEITDNLQKRFPTKKFMASPSNIAEVDLK